MPHTRYCYLLALGGPLLLAAGCGGKNKADDQLPPARVAVPVRVQQAGASSAAGPAGPSQAPQYSGTVAEGSGATLSFQVGGTITALPIEEGQRVRKGQLIAAVDATTYREQYAAQLAQAKLAEDTYRRVNEVYQQGSIAETKLVQARQQAEQARASARAAYQQVAHARLLAPFEGYIGTKQADLGAVASPGAPIATLVQLRQVKVNVAVPETEINRLRPGDRATVRVGAATDAPLTGRIDDISPVANEQTHAFTVGVLVDNPSLRLKPSMTAQVAFTQAAARQSATGPTALVLPLRAVQVDERNRHFVYLVRGNTVRWHEVQTGDLLGDGLAVTGGLTAQDQVVVDGYQKLYDQAPIKVLN
ncbi:efflux RND transporter periplasmic adaptor subunit [Hymenobacter setariae]|uniref:Efflux RND transporter periplasmic adaptor subunit n=1 Tax=Hymenobacter setariae TaxID=2594794 RepID=A0A558C3I5_9BACT|nr:efflux RND transporter periplasmic adaptor subunit [Hymenobacter setariae]TVT43316.1 efflux RND transporter periplasmic adaptor subunit [Hymenobacter setariae]